MLITPPHVHPDDNLLAKYIDDVIDPEAKEIVVAHLKVCEECTWIVVDTQRMANEAQTTR